MLNPPLTVQIMYCSTEGDLQFILYSAGNEHVQLVILHNAFNFNVIASKEHCK